MVFEILFEASRKRELILIDGGLCHWHLRRDGQLTILEIIATRAGAGKKMLDILKEKDAKSIFAKCPANLPSNHWYENRGFTCEGQEITKSGRMLNLWRYQI